MNSKEKAIFLRKQGYSYSYIALQTGLSKSTLSYHLACLPFTPNSETKKHTKAAALASAKTKARQKRDTITQARQIARKDVGEMNDRDLLMLGIGLYIGEGSKTQDLVRLVNADVRVIRVFIRWLRAMGLTKENIALRVHGYPDTDFKIVKRYWLKETKLPETSWQTPSIDKRTNKSSKRAGVHCYGTAHVTVRAAGKKEFGVKLARRISAYMDEVLQ